MLFIFYTLAFILSTSSCLHFKFKTSTRFIHNSFKLSSSSLYNNNNLLTEQAIEKSKPHENDNEIDFKHIYEAFCLYKDIYNTTIISSTYIVPYNDNNWPNQYQGCNLGQIYDNIKQIYSSSINISTPNRNKLVKLGFLPPLTDLKFELFLLAFQTLVKLQKGKQSVSRKFVVHTGSPDWPTVTHGLPLGMYWLPCTYTLLVVYFSVLVCVLYTVWCTYVVMSYYT